MKSGISILSFVAALMVFSLPLFGQIAVSGRGASDQVQNQSLIVDAAEPRDEYHKIEGSWNHVTTRLNCTTGAVLGTFQAMFTFSQGGTFWEASSNVSPALRAASHGVWSFDSKGTYHTAFQFFRFNADGTFAGRQVVRQVIELSPDWETYTATAISQVVDVSGNVIATNCASGVGTRFD